VYKRFKDVTCGKEKHAVSNRSTTNHTPITDLGYADDIADIIAFTNIERIDDFQKCLQKLHMTINPDTD
jgi:hypothetical protein